MDKCLKLCRYSEWINACECVDTVDDDGLSGRCQCLEIGCACLKKSVWLT